MRAQGFYDAAPARPTRAALSRVLARVNLFQIDSVNVLVRSHYLPLFSRIGPYPFELLQDAAWGRPSKRALFEYWGHEASLIPLDYRPLFVWRMERALHGRGMWRHISEIRSKKKLVREVLARIEAEGAAAASSFKDARGTGAWWGWSDVKRVLEYLFWSGQVTCARRTNGFERIYDIPQRVFPTAVLERRVYEPAEAHRELMLLAVRAFGVATESDARDYFRLDVADARDAIRDLTDAGAIVSVSVEGWKKPAYLDPAAVIPRREPRKNALLSPFDSLVWNRERTHRLFDFQYRIEIYTPAHKRTHGYYVLPFLHRGTLAGRVDLKADRASRSLLVQSAHFESPELRRSARGALDEELAKLAAFLGLDSVRTRAK